MINELYSLSIDRIREIKDDAECSDKYRDYFQTVAAFIVYMDKVYCDVNQGEYFNQSLLQLQEDNKKMYAHQMPEGYESSYLNPTFAVEKMGKTCGPILSALFAELQSLISYVFEQKKEEMLLRMELFLEIYGMFEDAYQENQDAPAYESLKETYSQFVFDYATEMMEAGVKNQFTTENDFAVSIIENCDLTTPDYLYRYGEYITENEITMVDFMDTLSQEDIRKIADTFTEGYRLGFIATGKDISIKKTVNIRYFLGFERVIKEAIANFRKMGLEPIVYRAQSSFMQGRGINKVGYVSTICNKQFECDHEYDKTLFFTSMYVTRKLEAYKAALEKYKNEAGVFGGPAVVESFGETPFSPKENKDALQLSSQERKLTVEYMSKAGALLNQYVKGEERSFTIIAFPIPEIGEAFAKIFEETIRINTLDYETYQKIQQCIIDTLDQADYVEVKGCGDNKTDLKIALWKLKNPDKETIFENCVADVNIPVGEVFTSPVLKGTNGNLHVTEVFLNGLQYKNLTLKFEDGMIADYSCDNFEDKEQGRKYIKDHVLHQHDTLPMGEFAIGTNTVAYMVSRKYKIEHLLPILIAEKTGPHFAVGDTCYSHEEDMVTYNPDGKAIVARENEVSALRHEDMGKAYMNCHTDITIPYDELGELTAVKKDGTRVEIIRNKRFVLEGTEELNKPFDE